MRRASTSEKLWLGHVGDLGNLAAIHDARIRAVIELAGNEPAATLPRDVTHCRFPLLDGSGNPKWLLRAAVEMVAQLLRSDVATLIVCGAGMSRTPAIAGAALATARGCTMGEGLNLVTQSGVADVSPGLWSDILASLG